MALYAQFDEAGLCQQIASTSGWGLFVAWGEKVEGFPGIQRLAKTGDVEDIAGLRKELERALDEDEFGETTVREIADELIHAIDAAGKAEILMITNGVAAVA